MLSEVHDSGLSSVGSWSGLWLSPPPAVVSLGLWGGRLVRLGALHVNIINFHVRTKCVQHVTLTRRYDDTHRRHDF